MSSPAKVRIGAVILAAGESARLGQAKQLLQFQGQSLARRAVAAATEANCSPILVVVGSERTSVARELAQMRAVIVENKNWRKGIGTSIRAGVQRLIDKSPHVEAIVLLVCDQPFVGPAVIKRLISGRAASGKSIVASSYADTLGVPALFDRLFFGELLALPDDRGAKPIILQNRENVAGISFRNGETDIDTAEDLKSVIGEQYGRG